MFIMGFLLSLCWKEESEEFCLVTWRFPRTVQGGLIFYYGGEWMRVDRDYFLPSKRHSYIGVQKLNWFGKILYWIMYRVFKWKN
jgi:hypothetical protein